MAPGDLRQRGHRVPPSAVPIRARRRRGPSSVAVTWMSSGLPVRRERFGDRPGGLDRAVERRRQDRTAVDRHDVVRAQRRESDLEHVALAAPRVQHRAAAALAMGVDQVIDRRVEPGLRQRLDDERALPVAIARASPNAAARSRRRCRNADRSARCARGSRSSTLTRRRRSGWPGHASTSTVSPGSAYGHVDRPVRRVGDAVAAPAEPGDRQPFHHGLDSRIAAPRQIRQDCSTTLPAVRSARAQRCPLGQRRQIAARRQQVEPPDQQRGERRRRRAKIRSRCRTRRGPPGNAST